MKTRSGREGEAPAEPYTCCRPETSREPAPEESQQPHALRFISWIVPSVILAAMPKCPACVAAYVALFTGCGISLAAAGAARWLISPTCLVGLAYLTVKALRDAITRRTPPASASADPASMPQ